MSLELLPAELLELVVVATAPLVGAAAVVVLKVPVEVPPIVEVPVEVFFVPPVVEVPVELPVVPPLVPGQLGASPPVPEVVLPSGGRQSLIAWQVSSGLPLLRLE